METYIHYSCSFFVNMLSINYLWNNDLLVFFLFCSKGKDTLRAGWVIQVFEYILKHSFFVEMYWFIQKFLSSMSYFYQPLIKQMNTFKDIRRNVFFRRLESTLQVLKRVNVTCLDENWIIYSIFITLVINIKIKCQIKPLFCCTLQYINYQRHHFPIFYTAVKK